MKIQLKKEFRGSFEVLDVREGTTIEDLYRSIEPQLPYRILAARVNNKFEALSYRIKKNVRSNCWISGHRQPAWYTRTAFVSSI